MTGLRVHDNANNEDAIVVHVFEPIFQPANPAAAGAYQVPPTTATVFLLLMWNDYSLHIQSINNLTGVL
jgi:hypothetical protein